MPPPPAPCLRLSRLLAVLALIMIALLGALAPAAIPLLAAATAVEGEDTGKVGILVVSTSAASVPAIFRFLSVKASSASFLFSSLTARSHSRSFRCDSHRNARTSSWRRAESRCREDSLGRLEEEAGGESEEKSPPLAPPPGLDRLLRTRRKEMGPGDPEAPPSLSSWPLSGLASPLLPLLAEVSVVKEETEAMVKEESPSAPPGKICVKISFNVGKGFGTNGKIR